MLMIFFPLFFLFPTESPSSVFGFLLHCVSLMLKGCRGFSFCQSKQGKDQFLPRALGLCWGNSLMPGNSQDSELCLYNLCIIIQPWAPFKDQPSRFNAPTHSPNLMYKISMLEARWEILKIYVCKRRKF